MQQSSAPSPSSGRKRARTPFHTLALSSFQDYRSTQESHCSRPFPCAIPHYPTSLARSSTLAPSPSLSPSRPLVSSSRSPYTPTRVSCSRLSPSLYLPPASLETGIPCFCHTSQISRSPPPPLSLRPSRGVLLAPYPSANSLLTAPFLTTSSFPCCSHHRRGLYNHCILSVPGLAALDGRSPRVWGQRKLYWTRLVDARFGEFMKMYNVGPDR